MKTKLQELLKSLPDSIHAGHIAGNSTVTKFTGNYKGNWISRGYAIWDSMNIIFAGSFEEVKEAIEEQISINSVED